MLGYHGVGLAQGELVVTPAQLDGQLGLLRDRGVSVIAMPSLLRHLDGEEPLPGPGVVLTFDDALKSAYDAAFPILVRHGAPFTLALNTQVIEQRHPLALGWQQVRDMRASGLCSLASHGHTHIALTRLGPALLRHELSLSRDLIAEHAGERPETFVYPYAEHRTFVEPYVASEGYRAAFAGWGAPITMRSRRYALPRRGVYRRMTLAGFASLLPTTWRA